MKTKNRSFAKSDAVTARLSAWTIWITSLICLLSGCSKERAVSPIETNREYQCEPLQMKFVSGGRIVNQYKPEGEKPFYISFDGKRIFASYKISNAPNLSIDGAEFSARRQEQQEGRTFDVMEFRKGGQLSHKFNIFVETTSGAEKNIGLIHQFSDNEFKSYGEVLHACK